MKPGMPSCIAWASMELSPDEVESRRMFARRNGYAAWLWPEIDRARWRNSLEDIVSITRKILNAEPSPKLVCDDIRAMCVAAYTSGMGPLLGFWIESGTLRASGELGELFHLHLSHNRQRMARLSSILHKVAQQLNNEGIVPVLLKGMDTAFRFFPEPGVRPLSDIDLFIPQRSIPRAEEVFSRLGFRRVPRTRLPYACDWIDPSERRQPRTLKFVHEDDPWSIDVLASLNKRLPTGFTMEFDVLRSCMQLADSREEEHFQVMAQPLLALYLAAHFSQTLLNATILRALEIVFVIRGGGEDPSFNWADFADSAGTMGGLRFVYPALVLVDQLAPGTIPAEILQAAERDAPNLRRAMANITLAGAQPLDRHSVRERFMWAANRREVLSQIAGELSLDDRGVPFGAAIYSIGTKLWALRRRRYSG
jgi:hypothetical protein